MATDELYDVVIAGAGPAGIEAALQAKAAGMKALLIDQEEAGSLIWNTMRGKKFFHAYGRNVDAPTGLLDFPDRKTGEELVNRWKKQATELGYLPHTQFLGIEEQGSEYIFKTNKGDFRGKAVLIASGTFANPKKLGAPGEDGNNKVAYEFDYLELPMDLKIIVVGGGNSAVETALETSLDNEVTLVVRKPHLASNVTERNKNELRKALENKELRICYESTITNLGDTANLKTPLGTEELSFDRIYLHIGYEKPEAYLRSLNLELGPDLLPIRNEFLETSRKNVFVAGALADSDSVVASMNDSIKIIKYLASQR